ncbi:alpha/beta hydrolase family esterase [Methylophilus medardicus]|uniref:Poly(3-hydroxybutyrate) depolymerase n=1 Tax=Methylophilus medardicus TaxID=2588534 RepID=A0A5B8CQ26_9PROT|nr:PHB depolymerase family esterase [Methylophilus medardicus]QDC43240.1 poly(3-hydroxybutyrate) depolymerase [Methylophilus medardicus]QDC48247.1 poly(3-hydroxybutyrate) depolymerase [Methylophilus medardicus]QDC51952.1 poly(3-hydroxybutyrate) depolymerase [Methylophilus medardicus]
MLFKTLFYSLLGSLLYFPLLACATQPQADSAFEVTVQGERRAYLVHMPAQAVSGQLLPMVLVLHGGLGNRQVQATERFYHQRSAADQYGYIAVFPNGYSRWPGGKFATWNAGNCCGPAVKKQSDDVAVIRAIIQAMQQRTPVDPKRIFVDGMSNGGMMAYRLACELSGTIRAIASVAGTDNTQQCQPDKPVAVLHIHAKNDDHVPFAGGKGQQSMADVSFNSVPATIQKWVQINQAQPQPERVLAVAGAYCDLYRGGRAAVQLCVTETGGHAWPGGTKPRGGQAGADAIDANALIWQFFNAQSGDE